MLDKVENTAADDEAEAEHDDAPEFNPKLETLCGDLRDVMLGRIRTTRKPWEQMTEAEQTDLANGLQLAASDMVRRMVRLMTSYDWPHAAVVLGEVKIKGEKGIEAKIACPNVEHNRNVLGDHVGQHVMVLMIDSDTFMGETAPVDIKKDQAELELADGEGVPDPAEAELPLGGAGQEIDPATPSEG